MNIFNQIKNVILKSNISPIKLLYMKCYGYLGLARPVPLVCTHSPHFVQLWWWPCSKGLISSGFESIMSGSPISPSPSRLPAITDDSDICGFPRVKGLRRGAVGALPSVSFRINGLWHGLKCIQRNVLIFVSVVCTLSGSSCLILKSSLG